MLNKVDRQFRLARIWSNSELKKISHLFGGKVINVSAGEDEDKEGNGYAPYFRNAAEYWISNYSPGSYRGFQGRPKEILIDLSGELPSEHVKRFDVVFNHTTLEHVFDVFAAFQNLCRLSQDIVILVVPFAQVQHENEGYLDYWRFSPTCIRRLFEVNGFQVVYESTNNDFNAAVYLFFVATCKPHLWETKMPPHEAISIAADWIGRSHRHLLKRLIRKIRGY